MDLDYGVQRAKLADDEYYGPVHGASVEDNAELTLCNIRLTHLWCIKFIMPDETQIDCKKCLKALQANKKTDTE